MTKLTVTERAVMALSTYISNAHDSNVNTWIKKKRYGADTPPDYKPQSGAWSSRGLSTTSFQLCGVLIKDTKLPFKAWKLSYTMGENSIPPYSWTLQTGSVTFQENLCWAGRFGLQATRPDPSYVLSVCRLSGNRLSLVMSWMITVT